MYEGSSCRASSLISSRCSRICLSFSLLSPCSNASRFAGGMVRIIRHAPVVTQIPLLNPIPCMQAYRISISDAFLGTPGRLRGFLRCFPRVRFSCPYPKALKIMPRSMAASNSLSEYMLARSTICSICSLRCPVRLWLSPSRYTFAEGDRASNLACNGCDVLFGRLWAG